MKFFIDTAKLDEIREAHSLGLVDGVTTNPSLILKAVSQAAYAPLLAQTVSAHRGQHRGGAADLQRRRPGVQHPDRVLPIQCHCHLDQANQYQDNAGVENCFGNSVCEERLHDGGQYQHYGDHQSYCKSPE